MNRDNQLIANAPSSAEVRKPVPVKLSMVGLNGSVKKVNGTIELTGDGMKPTTVSMKNGVAETDIVFDSDGNHLVNAKHRDTGESTSFSTRVSKKKIPWIGCEISESAKVASVVPNGPVGKTGIAVGDKVESVEGIPISDLDEFRKVLRLKAVVGASLKFVVSRDSTSLTHNVVVGDKNDSQ